MQSVLWFPIGSDTFRVHDAINSPTSRLLTLEVLWKGTDLASVNHSEFGSN